MGCTSRRVASLSGGIGWASRHAIKGHREWPRSDGKPQKSCPGPILTRLLEQWRGALAGAATYRVAADVALIREGAGQQYRVALHGTARLLGISRNVLRTHLKRMQLIE